MSYHNAESGIRSVVYSLAKQVMLYLFRGEAIGKTPNAKIGKLCDTNAAPYRLPKKRLTFPSFLPRIPTFLRLETDSTIAD